MRIPLQDTGADKEIMIEPGSLLANDHDTEPRRKAVDIPVAPMLGLPLPSFMLRGRFQRAVKCRVCDA